MSKKLNIGILLIIFMFIQQCKVIKPITDEVPVYKHGLEGYRELCMGTDTLRSILISKADAIIEFQGDRYETTLTLYHRIDSFIYVSAVSSGIEVFRGTIDHDTIRFIDRINKIVYHSPVKKRFGYQHPVSFSDLESLTSIYGCCMLLPQVQDFDEELLIFDGSKGYINKKVYIDKKKFKLQKFEFIQTKTNDYILGERTETDGMKFSSNFIVSDFEILAHGGELSYNRMIDIRMTVNRRKYSFIEFQ